MFYHFEYLECNKKYWLYYYKINKKCKYYNLLTFIALGFTNKSILFWPNSFFIWGLIKKLIFSGAICSIASNLRIPPIHYACKLPNENLIFKTLFIAFYIWNKTLRRIWLYIQPFTLTGKTSPGFLPTVYMLHQKVPILK